MSDIRSVLLLTGAEDVGAVGESAVDIAASLEAAGMIRPLVAGSCPSLLQHARERGLTAVDLSGSPSSSWHSWLERIMPTLDIVHVLGVAAADAVMPRALDALLPVVVTFDGARVGGRLRARRLRYRRSTAAAASPVRWLVHGRLATARLVRSGITHADDVTTLPLLPIGAVGAAGSAWAADRAAARRRISPLPGTRVVVGIGPLEVRMLRRLDVALARASAHAVGYWISAGERSRRPGRPSSRITVVDAAEAGHLLPAMDVLVADGTTIGAVHPAVDAVCAGVPVIVGPNDLAAELVRHGVNGFVCAPDDVPFALESAFAMAASHALRGSPRTTGPFLGAAELTARCYAAVLDRPLVRPILIGRRAAR